MAQKTFYLVQAFSAGRGNRLNADTPIPCKSAEGARRTAERLASSKAGVVALSTTADEELGEYGEEPTVLFRSGQLPAMFD